MRKNPGKIHNDFQGNGSAESFGILKNVKFSITLTKQIISAHCDNCL